MGNNNLMSTIQKAITRVGVVVSHGLNPKTVKVRVAKVEKNKQLRVVSFLKSTLWR